MHVCHCHRSFGAPDRYWRPMHDPEPGAEVRAVAFVEDDPSVLRMVRVPGGWHGQGVAAPHPELTGPEPWALAGQCWAGQEHPVVNVTDWSAGAGEHPGATAANAVTPMASGDDRPGNGV